MNFGGYWRTKAQRLTMVGEVCPQCGNKLFPPRDICPVCLGPAKTVYQMSGRGTVYSYSTVYAAPEGFDRQAPYLVALIGLEEGSLISAQLTDVESDEIRIGMPVEMVTRKIREEGQAGLIHYNYKFRPAMQPVAP